MDYGILSVLPAVVAIVLALIYKDVFVALIVSLLLGNIIVADFSIFQGLQGTLTGYISVFGSKSNTTILIILLMLGGLLSVIDKSGGIEGFINELLKKKGLIKNKKAANLFTWIIGMLVFTSGTLSILIAGAITRPINDALKNAPEKAAFIVHSTSGPVAMLIPLSLYAPFLIGLIEGNGVENGPTILIQSIPFNFYCIAAIFGVLALILSGKDFGPMKKVEAKSSTLVFEEINMPEKSETNDGTGKASYLIVPMILIVVVVIGYMLITGNGNILKGDGYGGMFFAVLSGLLYITAALMKDKVHSFSKIRDIFFKGCGGLLFITAILTLAFSLGSLMKVLGTGSYLSSVFTSMLSPGLLPAILFFSACIISFATGTSAGCIAVMMPIGIPMAVSMGVSIPLVVGAIAGGGIFGDHSSPISDTTVLSCSSTGCGVIEHVKTQLPYTLTFAGISTVLYLLLGFIL